MGVTVDSSGNVYAVGNTSSEGLGTYEAFIIKFDLSAYVGQSVKIRFAFASDPAYCTSDAPAMYGMMVDDISFGGYSNNGVDDGQMTYSSLVPVGEDLWHIATDATAPSPTHCMVCQNASGSYNTNMLNYLVSPPITLPNSGDMWVDFMVKGSYNDPNAFPEADYRDWETDRKSTRLNSSHITRSRMPSSA